MTTGISKGLSHVTLNVSDIDRSREFYRRLLGWTEEFAIDMSGPEFEAMVGIPGASGTVTGGSVGDNRLELVAMSFINGAPSHGLGLSKLVFETDDIDGAHAAATKAGATVVAEPHEIAGCRVFSVVDPDGQVIDFIHYLPDGGAWGGLLGRKELR